MPSIRTIFLWLALVVLVGLVVLSVYGAVIGGDQPAEMHGTGAARAKAFFNSTPMIAFWAVLLAVMAISPIVFRGLRKPAGLAMHLGIAMILVGGMWGSELAHHLRSETKFAWLHSDRIPRASITLEDRRA